LTVAVDTNVFLDTLLGDNEFFNYSSRCLALASEVEGIIVCEPVYAKLMASAEGSGNIKKKVIDFLKSLGVMLSPSSKEALEVAGDAYSRYVIVRVDGVYVECSSCGERRNYMQQMWTDGEMETAHSL